LVSRKLYQSLSDLSPAIRFIEQFHLLHVPVPGFIILQIEAIGKPIDSFGGYGYTTIMKIAYLADHPEHVSTVASWIFHEWDYLTPGVTLEQVEAKFQGHLSRDSIPLTLIALADAGQYTGSLVGTASLLVHDLATRTDLSPWLACVYVPPAQRNQGIGTRIVQAIARVAQRLRVGRLYLFTPDRERFYVRLGWRVVDRAEYHDQPVAIMVRMTYIADEYIRRMSTSGG